MTESQLSATSTSNKVLTRSAVIAKIEARLAGQLSDAALATWAFDRFYAIELENEVYEEGMEDQIADVLDTLMFDDDPSFQLDEEELRGLITQLAKV